MTPFPDNRMTAGLATHSKPGTYMLLVAPEMGEMGGMGRWRMRKGVGEDPKDKLLIPLISALDSPTHRCKAYKHSQGVGVEKGYGACGVGKKGGSHMYGKR